MNTKAYYSIMIMMLVVILMGCNSDDDNNSNQVTHPVPTAVISYTPTSPTVGQTVSLDGTGSNTSYGVAYVGNPANLTFSWTLTRPTGSTSTLNSATSATPTFTPDKAGSYEAALTVTDPATNKTSVQSSQTITVADIPNPTAVITAPGTGTVGTQVSLSGTSSTTSYGASFTSTPSANLTFTWGLTVPTNSTAVLSSATDASPVFTPDLEGTYTVSLTVTDVATTKVSTQVQAQVTVPVPSPTAVITAPGTGTVGTQVSLSGTSSTTSYGASFTSTPSANLTFTWGLTVPTNSTAVLSSGTDASPVFTPDLEGTYTVSLTVTDVATSEVSTQAQAQITISMPKLTVALTNTPATKSIVLTSGTSVFPVTLSANAAEDLTVTGLVVRSDNDAVVYQVDLYGGTSSTLVTTYLSTAYASAGLVTFTGLSITVPASGNYYLAAQVMFMPNGVAGQSLTLSIDTTQDITAVGATSASTLYNTTSVTTDQVIGPAGAGASADMMNWEEWNIRDSFVQATMPNEASGTRSTPNGSNQVIGRFTLTPQSNVSAQPYIYGVFVKIVGKAQAENITAYQGVTLLGQSAVYHDSRKRLMSSDVPDSFADGTETLHWIQFTNGLLLSAATVVEIQANVYTVGTTGDSWSLTVSLCLDSFIWYDDRDQVTNPNSMRATYLDATSGALLSPSASLVFAGGGSAMTDPPTAVIVAAQATVVQVSNSKIIVLWNRPVWKTQGYGAGYFTIHDATPSSTTDVGEVFATVPAPTVYPRNWTTITYHNIYTQVPNQVDLVTNPVSPTLDIIVVGGNGTPATDHSLNSSIIDCR